MNQLFERNIIKIFAKLRRKFNPPSSDQYRYLQIGKYTTKHVDWDQITRQPTNIEKHFDILMENIGAVKKQVPVDGHV